MLRSHVEFTDDSISISYKDGSNRELVLNREEQSLGYRFGTGTPRDMSDVFSIIRGVYSHQLVQKFFSEPQLTPDVRFYLENLLENYFNVINAPVKTVKPQTYP